MAVPGRLAHAAIVATILGGAALAIAAGLAARDLHAAGAEVGRASAELHAAAQPDAASLAGLASATRQAAGRASRARSRLRSSPWVRLAAAVPVAGRPFRWASSAASATAALLDAAARDAGRIAGELHTPQAGAGRVAQLAAVRRDLADLEAELQATQVGGGGLLPPPFSSYRDRLERDRRRALDALRRSDVAVGGLQRFLAGPDSYLVLAANNAEMRGLGGMALQAGVLTTSDGSLHAGQFRPTEQLLLRDPVDLPGPFQQVYGWLDPGREWRNTDTSPDFPVVAPLYASMAASDGLGRVSGVIQLDVVALRLLLDVVGPVQAGGVTYTSTNVGPLVMHDLYVRYAADEASRKDVLSGLAGAVLSAVEERTWEPDRLPRALRQAATGRHLLVWSSDPVESQAWQTLGVDGRLPADGLLVTVQNQGGNKLDWFLRPSLALTRLGHRRDGQRYRLTVNLDLPPTPAEPAYIAGDGSAALAPGNYRAFIAVYLPDGAVDVAPGGASPLVAGVDGPLKMVAVRVDVAGGTRRTVTFDFSLPAGEQSVVLVPDARWVAPPVRFGSLALTEDAPVSLRLAANQ